MFGWNASNKISDKLNILLNSISKMYVCWLSKKIINPWDNTTASLTQSLELSKTLWNMHYIREPYLLSEKKNSI